MRAFLSVALVLPIVGCNWIELGRNALTYDTIAAGQAANLAVAGDLAYVTLADSGFAVVDLRSGQPLATVPPATGSESVDDIAIADGLAFALDARDTGHVSVYSLRDPARPALVGTPRRVPVGPFSGISARDGLCLISGGTSALTAWRYDSTGALDGPVATADLGRGQPDVLLGGNGIAFVSTHYWGPHFGLDIIRYDSSARRIDRVGRVEIDGAGFTAGGAKPANFPIVSAQLNDSTVLVAFARGVAIVRLASHSTPRLERVIDVGGPAVSVDADATSVIVAVAGSAPALVLLDLAGAEPRVVRRITLSPGTNPAAVRFSGQRVALAARSQGILVFKR